MKYRVLILIIIISFACKNRNVNENQSEIKADKLLCFTEITNKNKSNNQYDKVVSYLSDTIKYFTGKTPHSHNPDIVNCKVDELILFDNESENCLLFLLEIYPDNFTIDKVRLVKGFKTDTIWKFKLYPVISHFRKYNDNKKYSHQQLSDEIRLLLIEKGLLKVSNVS